MKLRVALGALLMAVAMTLGWSTTHSDRADRDGESCRSACEEVAAQCITFCSEHENPVECESDCRDDEQDCMARCR